MTGEQEEKKTYEPTLSRRVEREAAEAMEQKGAPAKLIAALLFCLTCTYACVFVAQLIDIIGMYLLRFFDSTVAHAVLYLLPLAVLAASLLFGVLPLWLGRVRMAGLIVEGEDPELRELFYYFTSVRRHWRAVRICLTALLQTALPAALIGLAAYGMYRLYWLIQAPLHANLLAVIVANFLLFGLGLAALLVLLSGRWLLFLGIAVGNEELSFGRSLRLAFSCGHVFDVFRFCCRRAWHLLLSLVSIGVLYVLRYAHTLPTSYLRLAKALCPKGEN